MFRSHSKKEWGGTLIYDFLLGFNMVYDIKINKIEFISDFKIARDMMIREAKYQGYEEYQDCKDLDYESMEYFIKYHDFYLLKVGNAIVGTFGIFRLNTGIDWIFGLTIREGYRGKGIGTFAFKWIVDNYKDLAWYTKKVDWYLKNINRNVYKISGDLYFHFAQFSFPIKEILMSTDDFILNIDKEKLLWDTLYDLDDTICYFIYENNTSLENAIESHKVEFLKRKSI